MQYAFREKLVIGQVLAIQTDVRNRDDIYRMVQATLERWGRIDVKRDFQSSPDHQPGKDALGNPG